MIALLARGDSHAEIQAHMQENFGRTPQPGTITAVKKRNADNLNMIRARVLAKEEHDALNIKSKANHLISERLKREEDRARVIAKANKEYLTGEIDSFEHDKIMRTMNETKLTDLVSVSKEMHAQSKSDDLPVIPQRDLADLVAAIKSGDEVTLNQIIFNGGVTDAEYIPATGGDIPSLQPGKD